MMALEKEVNKLKKQHRNLIAHGDNDASTNRKIE